MTRRYEPIGGLDLYAYADGLLDGDAIRRAEIERYLASDADAAAHVAEIRAQNREIREAFGDAIARPVPDRLMGALEQGNGRRGRHVAVASAVAVLLLIVGGGGWLAGQNGDVDQLEAFARRAAVEHQTGATFGGVQPAGASPSAAVTEPLTWLNERIALEIKAPDLTDEGFELVAKAMIGPGGDRIVQLVYQSQEGVLLNLFLRPRWEERSSSIDVVRSDDVDVHYWLDGPLAFALTSNVQETDAERLARAVHEAVARSRLAEPAPKALLSEGVPELHGSEGEGRIMPASPSVPAPFESRPAAGPQFN